jgi:hypothetical protein
MSVEMNIYPVGPLPGFDIDGKYIESYEEYAFRDYGFVFKPCATKNMDQLFSYFHAIQNYPEYYLGPAKKLAICKCPKSGVEEWYNVDRYLTVSNPINGSLVTVNYKRKDKIYSREFIFMGWVKQKVHEWTMQNGTILQLEQRFVDGLLDRDRRYLRMNR